MANLRNLNAAYFQIFTNAPLIAYIANLKKKLLVYFHPVGGEIDVELN